jgi:hypothetical protein
MRCQPDKYVVLEKTDGIRFFIVVFEPMCVFIDRNLRVFTVPTQVSQRLFQGTMLDAEFAWNSATRQWTFCVFDCLAYCGTITTQEPFLQRLDRARHACTGITLPACFATIMVKRAQPLHCVPDIVKAMHLQSPTCSTAPMASALPAVPPTSTLSSTLSVEAAPVAPASATAPAHAGGQFNGFRTDGLVFVPLIGPAVVGRQASLKKWKLAEQHTVDFYVTHRHGDIFDLMVSDDRNTSNMMTFGHAVWSGESLASCNIGVDQLKHAIVECAYHLATNTWQPVKIRLDKRHPNSNRTVQQTVLNVRENISVADLVARFHSSTVEAGVDVGGIASGSAGVVAGAVACSIAAQVGITYEQCMQRAKTR